MNLYYITVCIGVNNKLLVLVLVLVLVLLFLFMRAQIVTFSQDFFHHGDTIYHPKLATQKMAAQSTGGACQSSEMAAMLNSLYFVFKNVFLLKYWVKHYDYIVKWCSGI